MMRPSVPVDLLAHLRRARDVADRRYAEPLDLDALADGVKVQFAAWSRVRWSPGRVSGTSR